MALKAMMKAKQLRAKQAELEALLATREELATREADLAKAIEEAETDEEQATVEEAVTAYEADKKKNDEDIEAAQAEVDTMTAELEELEAKQTAPVDEPAPAPAPAEARKEIKTMETRAKTDRYTTMREAIRPYIERDDVKAMLDTCRAAIKEKRAITGTGLLLPDVFLGILRENVIEYSKLYRRVTVRTVSGTSRMAIAGTIPEAVWTEMCANLNELDLAFNSLEMDGWKVGGYMAVCNATLEDSEVDLAAEIMTALAQAIGIALDKAILYGTGTRMPEGIMARLVQTSQPSDYPATARPWEDLHTRNIRTIAAGVTGTALLTELTIDSGYAKGAYSRGPKTWVMNETTYTALIANAITVTAAGAIVSGVNGTMPVIGGDVVVLNFIPDNVIIGGYFDLYLLAERRDVRFFTSEHAFFLADQTVFKGTARYDGAPMIAEGFVAIGLNGVTPSAAMTFAPDTANAAPQLSALTIGSLVLSPTFDADVTAYTSTASTGGTAKVTATAADAADGVTITVNGTPMKNGGTATWAAGTNTVAVTVTNNTDPSATAVYVVTVTAS